MKTNKLYKITEHSDSLVSVDIWDDVMEKYDTSTFKADLNAYVKDENDHQFMDKMGWGNGSTVQRGSFKTLRETLLPHLKAWSLAERNKHN